MRKLTSREPAHGPSAIRAAAERSPCGGAWLGLTPSQALRPALPPDNRSAAARTTEKP